MINIPKHFTFLIGSTRGKKTTSESIVNYLMMHLGAGNVLCSKFRVFQTERDAEHFREMADSIRESSLLVLCAPLFVDAPPAVLLKTAERLASDFPDVLTGKNLIGVIHSGYPEASHRDAALRVLHHFADQTRMVWKGGIGFGGTSPIDGRSLGEAGFYTRRMRKVLDVLADFAAAGSDIPEELAVIAGRLPVPFPVKLMPLLLNLRLSMSGGKKNTEVFAEPYSQE